MMVKSARELNSYSLHHKGGVVLRLLEEGLNYQTSGEGIVLIISMIMMTPFKRKYQYEDKLIKIVRSHHLL